MSSNNITIAVAILGLIGTLAGTFGGILVTHHLSRDAAFERSQTQQAIKAYSVALKTVFGQNAFLPLTLSADGEVLKKLAALKEVHSEKGDDLQNEQLKAAAMATIQAMRVHVTGDDDVSADTLNAIDRLMF